MKILFRQCLRGSIYLLLSSFALPIHAQVSVSGLITDSSNMPIPGVNILLKNTTTGTTTNFEGRFKLEASPSDTLVVSYIGFKTQELAVREQVFFTINLTPEANTLAAVLINAGYYTTTDRERTGSIAKVTAKEIELQPVVSPLQALQGRMAGVEVISNSTLPGAAPTIRIRGQNSLRPNGNYPLYIIDGVPFNSTPLETNSTLSFTGIDPLSTINPADIKSIEVLKDADATAIYGSRGANGVVLITTKKGTTGETTVQARIRSGFSEAPNRIDLLKTSEYLKIRQKAFENDGIVPNENNAYDLLVWNQNRNTDWQEKFFGKQAGFTQANLSISGGSSTTRYRVNGSYLKQGSIYPGSASFQKATGSVQLNHLSKDNKFSLNMAITYGADKNHTVGIGSLIPQVFSLAPNAPKIFNEDGSLHWEEWSEVGKENPFQGYLNTSDIKIHNTLANLNLSYRLMKGFKLSSNFGYTHLNSNELTKRPKESYNPQYKEFIDHESAHLQGESTSWIIEPQLSYQENIEKLGIKALIGATLQEQLNLQTGVTGTGYATRSMIGNLAAATNLSRGLHQEANYRYMAFFSRLGLDWDKKYFINLTGRRDGSSRFGPDKRFANFGAIGAAWIFTEEVWVIKKIPWLSFGKLRGSYGITGSDQIGDYGYLDSYVATVGPGGLYPTQLANPNYSWEVNKKLEAAVQLGFFKDRLQLNVSYYKNRSSNQLVGYSLPSITGFTSVQANLPATVENRGWEIEAYAKVINTDDWKWQSTLNFTLPKNELVNYPNIEQSPYANSYRVGEPLNIALLYQYEGINPKTGYYQITDVNDDGRLDYEDRVVVKDRNSKFYGGWQNTLQYKNFDIQFLLQFAKKEGEFALFDAGRVGALRQEDYIGLEGDKFQTISTQLDAIRGYSNLIQTSLPYTDASYIRLKSFALSYSIPNTPLQKIGIKNCKLFVQGQNLFTLSNYRGMDPEMAKGQGTAFGALRTFTTGIEVKF
ncbi:TonB-linked SusC/RagA family outer membrane protein [Mesonia hippocampi]|uniref:TonB-linked SusC/RagA family outer membrane protein n=1 Tax=Mesonia hippocampi TaxID=1628250 RepID=A0A840F0W1_9FLAO|nr:SusC/RagA family TonB-linked outer membrane protein [Mesonia hippocampi]MBB4119904.1 TonB-linked SusC/RagA family outer membrane protein [Mesonia hippocampi]